MIVGGKNMGMHQDMEKILITEEQIQQKVKELGALLTKEYEGRFPLLVGVLKARCRLWQI